MWVWIKTVLESAAENADEVEDEEGSGGNGIGGGSQSATIEDYPIEDDSFEGGGHGDQSHLEENATDRPQFSSSYPEKPPLYTNQNPVPLNATNPMPSVGNITTLDVLKTFNKTKVYIPVVIPQKANKKKNKTEPLEKGKHPELSSVSTLVKASSKLEVKNESVKPLKYDENFTILVAKRNKTEAELRKNATNAKAHRRKRRAPFSYEETSGEDEDYKSEESMESDDESGIQDADHDYDNDYEYVKPPMGSHESNPSGEGESSEGLDEMGPSGPSAPDAYDIHGYRGQQQTTRWPPNSPIQPAYALAEGQTPAPHMKSGRPQMFKPQLKDYGAGHHRHPGGATSSSSFNMGLDEHHHHHFYDKVKETHANKPPYYKHTTKFLIPPEIYRKYPGKHKHFHHLKTPEGQKVIAESEENHNFDPNTLTEKDHEDAYKTYDEEDIAVDVNYDDSDKPQAPQYHRKPHKPHKKPGNANRPRPITTLKPTMPKNHMHTKRNGMFNQKHMMKYKVPRGRLSRMPDLSGPDLPSGSVTPGKSGSRNKAEVERIFEAVDKAMRFSGMKSSSSLTSPSGPAGPIGSVGPSPMLWPLGFPKGLPLNKVMPSRS